MYEDLMEALKERGHSEEDIKNMSSSRKFQEFCNWHGLIGWGSTLESVLDECRKQDRVEVRS